MGIRWQVMCKSCGKKSEPCTPLPREPSCCNKPNFTLINYDLPREKKEIPFAVCLYAAFIGGTK